MTESPSIVRTASRRLYLILFSGVVFAAYAAAVTNVGSGAAQLLLTLAMLAIVARGWVLRDRIDAFNLTDREQPASGLQIVAGVLLVMLVFLILSNAFALAHHMLGMSWALG